MAYLSKGDYERREASAERRGEGNYQILLEAGVNEDIAELIAYNLTYIRHNMHVETDKLVKGYEGANDPSEYYDRISREIQCDSRFKDIPLFDFSEIDTMDYLQDYDDEQPEDHDSEEWNEWYAENYERIYGEWEEVNQKIESWLAKIDKKYGTNLCPTGTQRLH